MALGYTPIKEKFMWTEGWGNPSSEHVDAGVGYTHEEDKSRPLTYGSILVIFFPPSRKYPSGGFHQKGEGVGLGICPKNIYSETLDKTTKISYIKFGVVCLFF